MKVSTEDGKTFVLEGENEADQLLLDALDIQRTVALLYPVRSAGGPPWTNRAFVIEVNANSEAASVAKAQRQALSALGELFRLGLREAAQHWHIGADAADPQAQVSLTTLLEQLQLMERRLGARILNLEALAKEVERAHRTSVQVGGGL